MSILFYLLFVYFGCTALCGLRDHSSPDPGSNLGPGNESAKS